MSTTLTRPVTADELLAMPDDGYCYELVKGELIRMAPAGFQHGNVAIRIGALLHDYVVRNKLGQTCGAETGFILRQNPDTVRAPDAAFVSQDRLDKAGIPVGFWIGPPDLAVEVVSPGDSAKEVKEKALEWLEAATQLVWIVNPKLRTVTVYRSLIDIVTLTEKDTLDGGEVVPGFEIKVADIFA